MTQLPPTPRDVRTAAEYVGRARCLKAWSGYSYRELSRRAAANGDHLPPSTLATALRRASLPGEQLVAAFVRACGCDPATVDEWTTVRRRIAMAAEDGAARPPFRGRACTVGADDRSVQAKPAVGTPPSAVRTLVGPPLQGREPVVERPPHVARHAGPGRDQRPGRRVSGPGRRPGLIGLLAVGAVTLACAVGGTPHPGRSSVGRQAAPEPPRPTGPLADGWYRIHTARDGRCLGVAGTKGTPSVRRQGCGRGDGQRFYFEYAGGRAYRIKAGRPGGASGCLTVDAMSARGNLRLRECVPADPSQLLRIEVVPEGRQHHWLPSRLRLGAMADRDGWVPVRATGQGGDDLGFYLTDPERPAGPSGDGDAP